MAKFKVGDRVAYYGKDPAIYRKRGTVSDVSQIRGETFVTVDLDDGEEWGAPEKDWSFMNSCARNAIKVGDTVTYKLDAPGNKGKKYIVLEEGRTGYVWLADMDGRGNGMEVKRADLVAANSCRSTNAVVAKALNACGTARNAWGDEAQVDGLITKMMGLIKQIKPIARQLYDTAFELDDAGSVWLGRNQGSKNAQKVKVAVDRANKVMSRLANFTSGLD
jgi:hypothetical protein